jgi:hypothetical protein
VRGSISRPSIGVGARHWGRIGSSGHPREFRLPKAPAHSPERGSAAASYIGEEAASIGLMQPAPSLLDQLSVEDGGWSI